MMSRYRFEQAIKLGPLARYRLRAEVLLERINKPGRQPLVQISPEDCELLHRIASTPKEGDDVLLGRFDYIYEADTDRKEQ
jgi:hypothetical protein